MQTPTGRPRPTHPIPRPRPHGPADLGILADDLDHLADMHRSVSPESEPGRSSQAQVSGAVSYADPRTGLYGDPRTELYPEPFAGSHGDLHGDPYADPDAEPQALHGSPYADPNGDLYTGPDADLDPAWPGQSADAEPADPAVPAGPIFVDASGRRRKLARRASLVGAAIVTGYAGLLAVSFVGGPIPPKALLPVPGMPERAPAPVSTSVAGNGTDGANGASTSGKPGGTEHSAGGRPAGGTTQAQPTTHAGATSGKPNPSTPSAPQPTSSISALPLPTPTSPPSSTGAASATSTHGNPTPGHGHKSSPAPTG